MPPCGSAWQHGDVVDGVQAVQGLDTPGLLLFGALGAAGAELLNMRALFERNRSKWHSNKRTVAFWMFALGFVVFGAVTTYAHSWMAQISPWLAMNVGFTWPLLLRRGAGALPDKGVGTVDEPAATP